MQIECKAGRVLATYDDGVTVPAREGAFVLSWPGSASDLPGDGTMPPITADLLAAYAAAKRYVVETGGYTHNGHLIATDEASQSKIGNAALGATVVGSAFTTDWKGKDGVFFTLDQAGMMAMATAVLNFVNACYAVEQTVVAAITAGTIVDLAGVDAAAWPNGAAS